MIGPPLPSRRSNSDLESRFSFLDIHTTWIHFALAPCHHSRHHLPLFSAATGGSWNWFLSHGYSVTLTHSSRDPAPSIHTTTTAPTHLLKRDLHPSLRGSTCSLVENSSLQSAPHSFFLPTTLTHGAILVTTGPRPNYLSYSPRY